MNILHRHPHNVRETVVGRSLRANMVLKKEDVYASKSGKWEPIPTPLIGDRVQDDTSTVFIRPEK